MSEIEWLTGWKPTHVLRVTPPLDDEQGASPHVPGEATPARREAVATLVEGQGWARRRASAFVAQHGPESAREMVGTPEVEA